MGFPATGWVYGLGFRGFVFRVKVKILGLRIHPWRPGEWGIIHLNVVKEQLSNHMHFLKFREHKTKKSMGPICKWLPEGTARAIMLGIPNSEISSRFSSRFWEICW